MTIPNVFTIYFQEKHQKFLFGFERFGTELASIGMGNQEKKQNLKQFLRVLAYLMTLVELVFAFDLQASLLLVLVMVVLVEGYLSYKIRKMID